MIFAIASTTSPTVAQRIFTIDNVSGATVNQSLFVNQNFGVQQLSTFYGALVANSTTTLNAATTVNSTLNVLNHLTCAGTGSFDSLTVNGVAITSSGGGGSYLPLTGGVVNGTLTVWQSPVVTFSLGTLNISSYWFSSV